MGFPRRPRPTPKQAASSSSDSTIQSGSSSLPASKRLRLDHPLVFNSEHIKIFLVIAKLAPEEVSQLTRAIESNGGKCVSRAEEATIIVSNTRVWNRMKKYLPERGYESKKFAKLEWLQDSIATGIQQPFNEKYTIPIPSPLDHLHLVNDRSSRQGSASPAPSTLSRADTATPEPEDLPECQRLVEEIAQKPPVYPTLGTSTWVTSRATPPRWQNKRFACQRWHPLICINQGLIEELKHIRDFNRLEGEERRYMTYSKGMAAIKSYPYPIRSVKEAKGILGVGDKIANQCGEYIKTGKIFAAEQFKNTPRQKALLEFTKIHGVGSKTAKDLYDNDGCRTIDDIRQLRKARPNILPSMGDNSIDLVEDFDKKIPRAEVEEIAGIVNKYLQQIIPGAEYTVVGGYRRGKAESNDIDIVFTHPEGGKHRDALQTLTETLKTVGYITEVLYMAFTDSKRDETMQHFHASHMDPLDKVFGVWLSPPNGTTRKQAIHRRVDFIAAPYRYYACAVLGWSGSTTFERDLRLYADKVKGMKFDSGGLWYRATSREIFVKSEEEIFEVLGLEYIPPEWRNCDS